MLLNLNPTALTIFILLLQHCVYECICVCVCVCVYMAQVWIFFKFLSVHYPTCPFVDPQFMKYFIDYSLASFEYHVSQMLLPGTICIM